ncbi:FG-GAP repeat domain-containing protein [Coleofasciculus sp. E2-BRE-01]|uniref:FG-GAP repeat domain-containing protein n=1 Tax=Coleofasciculus sp. E2-BRE-01 TaxID=3069524 RepID=UPI0032FEAAFF
MLTIRTLALVICTAVLVIAINYIVGQPDNEELNLSTENKTWFTSRPLRSHEFRLFDLGVVDVNIVKYGCPALPTAWVDFNADNRLDIYTVGYQGTGQTATLPSQLYRQDSDGSFVNMTSPTNLDFPNMRTLAWLDADRDRDIDLLWHPQIYMSPIKEPKIFALEGDILDFQNLAQGIRSFDEVEIFT